MTEAIHPTAVVDPRARLGPGVRVGAYSIIGPEVVLGAGCQVGHHAVLEGAVVAAERTRIGHGAMIGGAPQDLKYREGTPSGVQIGADTVIREYVTIHRASREGGWTRIGDGCLVMAMSHIAHDCRIGDRVIIINYAGLTGHVEVDEGATVGGLTGIHPFTRVGAYAYIGGCSKVVQDVPPAIVADGAPAAARAVNLIGLRRAGVDAETRRQLQAAFRILYRSGLAPRSAAERIRAELPPLPLLGRLVEFIEGSRRGIIGPPRQGAGGALAEAEEERIF
jgi:UDP-N-acetylglucosamine acyltransferase